MLRCVRISNSRDRVAFVIRARRRPPGFQRDCTGARGSPEMSAGGQNPKSPSARLTSALPLKAVVARRARHVRLGPIGDIRLSLDHLIGADK
jgi:hypothetical protein